MTQQEAEAKILDAMRQIEEVRRAFCPEDDYLTLSINNGNVIFNNTYWEHSEGQLKVYRASYFSEVKP